MAADKHSDLPASERHLGWAISAVLAGAMVRHEKWVPETYWALSESGLNVTWVTSFGDGGPVSLGGHVGCTGFYIYEPEPEDAPEPTYGERIAALETKYGELRKLISGEFDALSARITEVSRMAQNVTTRATGTIGGGDLSKLR